MKRRDYLVLLSALSMLLLIASCQPDLNDPNPDPTNPTSPTGPDSTQLIKSIKSNYYLDNNQPDSGTETYTYDTVNRKIRELLKGTTSAGLDSVMIVYSYNTNHLLTGIEWNYSPGYTITAGDQLNASFEYDDQQVIKKMTLNLQDSSIIYNFVKTPTASGYDLVMGAHSSYIWWFDKFQFTSSFDNNNRLLKFRNDAILHNNPLGTDTTMAYSDSLVYSSSGNLQKVYRRYDPTNVWVMYEFGTRYDKGDQLSKQRKLLFNGIADIPFDQTYLFWPLSSVAYSFYDGYEHYQFDAFPCHTSSFSSLGTSIENVNHIVTFDNRDRLVSFAGAIYNGGQAQKDDLKWTITYYK